MTLSNAFSSILVVDDDVMIQRLIRDILAQEFQVFTAVDGEEALAILRREPGISAVVADQMMPGMTGVDLLQRSISTHPHAARVLVTASGSVDDVKDAVNLARIQRFLVKPFRPLELLGTVRGAVHEANLEEQNGRLLVELGEKNRLLARALSEVQTHERKLEAEVERRTAELKQAVAMLEELALRDGLTGLYNHRFFQEALTAEVARAGRHGRKVGLIFLDVDHFKNYNDLNGHPAGDALLKQLAVILTNTGAVPEVRIRGRISDITCRYGGEEFVIILPEADRQGAGIRAERVRALIQDFAFAGRERQPGGQVSVSIGVAAFPEDAVTKVELVKAADDALLRAKREGRNRVRFAGQP